jgi:chemotaxis protein MotA
MSWSRSRQGFAVRTAPAFFSLRIQSVGGWAGNCLLVGGGYPLATPQAVLSGQSREQPAAQRRLSERVDLSLLAGVAIAFGATILGICCTGISFLYFLQPSGALIVLGGTLGVILVTTPRHSVMHSLRRVKELLSVPEVNRESLVDEIIDCAKVVRRKGVLSLEESIPKTNDRFLTKGLQLIVDLTKRAELQSILETDLRMAERHGEADAKALEVAGGFAPTIGIIGTVVGLIDVLRQFSKVQSVGYGVGTAFVSTIYGLVLANLVLLPVAHRVRARVAENFETQEMILEGVLSIVDSVHPSLMRMRLESFVRRADLKHNRAKPEVNGS